MNEYFNLLPEWVKCIIFAELIVFNSMLLAAIIVTVWLSIELRKLKKQNKK